MSSSLLAQIQDYITIAQDTGVSVLCLLADRYAFDQDTLTMLENIINSEF